MTPKSNVHVQPNYLVLHKAALQEAVLIGAGPFLVGAGLSGSSSASVSGPRLQSTSSSPRRRVYTLCLRGYIHCAYAPGRDGNPLRSRFSPEAGGGLGNLSRAEPRERGRRSTREMRHFERRSLLLCTITLTHEAIWLSFARAAKKTAPNENSAGPYQDCARGACSLVTGSRS